MKLSQLKANPNNPRLIKDDKFKKLVKSIKQSPSFMLLNPIKVDEDMMILGGNMRFKACLELKWKEAPVEIFTREHAAQNNKSRQESGEPEATYEEQCREFIIKDNVGYGENDWDILANEWDPVQLEEWGMDLPGFDINGDGFGDEFSLNDGDKPPFQQMTFTLADEQAEQVKNALEDIKATDEYKYAETMGNENSNGNAIYLIAMQWAEQRT